MQIIMTIHLNSSKLCPKLSVNFVLGHGVNMKVTTVVAYGIHIVILKKMQFLIGIISSRTAVSRL